QLLHGGTHEAERCGGGSREAGRSCVRIPTRPSRAVSGSLRRGSLESGRRSCSRPAPTAALLVSALDLPAAPPPLARLPPASGLPALPQLRPAASAPAGHRSLVSARGS